MLLLVFSLHAHLLIYFFLLTYYLPMPPLIASMEFFIIPVCIGLSWVIFTHSQLFHFRFIFSMHWSLHLAGAPISLLVLCIPLLAGHHVIIPQRIGGWIGPYGDGILSVGFGLPMGLQPLTPSIFLSSYYPPSQMLPY
eukprot:Gb_24512 [translate_table: standard]